MITDQKDMTLPADERLLADADQLPEIIKVLVVEDDEVDRMAFERLVRRHSLPYECCVAAGLGEAREALEDQVFDIILTDFHLGDGSGLELLELRSEIPVVVITGAGGEETAVRALRAGAFDYLVKDTQGRYLEMVPVIVENALRQQLVERRVRILTQALKAINDAIFVTDLKGRLIFVNKTFSRMYGYGQMEVLGRPSEILWAQGEEHELEPTPAEDLPRAGQRGECVQRRWDGSIFPALLSRSAIFDERGGRVAAVGAVRDISERKRSEEALKVSEERYALAAAGANDGLWDWDLLTDQVYYSTRWKTTLGYLEDEIGDHIDSWLSLVHAEDIDLLRTQLSAHLEGRSPYFENEHRIRTKTDDYRWVQVRGLAVRSNGKATRLAGSQRDITDRKRAESQLIHAALHDDLTGLPNRTLFMDRLETALARAQRHSHTFGVIFLDLDRFKLINDSLGHQAGDELLRAIGRRLAGCLRQVDTVARLGGDEFAILLDDYTEVNAVAEKVQKALKAPFDIGGHECFTSASLGIALSSNEYSKPEDLLRDADIAMYRAKALGRRRQVIFQPHMHSQAIAALNLENDLRRAVEREELEVHFQPIVDLRTGALSAFEALVRWRHPQRGLVMPGEFLPMAQETDLSADIGWWVLSESCRQLRAWGKAAENIAVSVNLDGRQVSAFDLVNRVEKTLARAGLDPGRLRLEITESMIIHNPELVASVLGRLRKRGVHLHIDDFGTGYSSLSQLKAFPVDSLKVDRSFIFRMQENSDDHEIVRAIVQLAHNLGLEVMAEGIEQESQLTELRRMGCEFGQGYLFARALHPDQVPELLSAASDFPGFAAG